MRRKIVILGSTGSIGKSTLDVIISKFLNFDCMLSLFLRKFSKFTGLGSKENILKHFNSLNIPLNLGNNLSSPYVFIIDKDKKLRGRNDDEDTGTLYGFDARSVAEINKKMIDDVKVIFAEYRLALKRYNKTERN